MDPVDVEELLPADAEADIDALFDASNEAIEDVSTEDDLEVVQSEPDPIGRDWSYDFNAGSFVNVGHSPLTVRGDAALAVWIEKCLRTHRGASVVHLPEYGLIKPLGDYLGGDPYDTFEMKTDIEEAITFHPHVTKLEDIRIDISDVGAEISFRVILADGGEVPFDSELTVEA